jgi:16S rRNA (cytidine1402-2'-O)-methyltransferase
MTSPASNSGAFLAVIADAAQQTYPPATLYVVATPVGNAADIGLRALHVLSMADAVACEDTRNTAHLLSRYGLSKELIAAHEHNEREAAQKLVERLQAGQRIALVSDAGTPAVSDPGARIVDAVHEAGLRVMPLPGPSAAVAALSASGLVDDGFRFVGFLPNKPKQRESALDALRATKATLVFYEAPHRIVETVEAIATAFEPSRRIVFARELTKLFEQIHHCPLPEAADWLKADPNRQRGEFVLVVEGAPETGDDELAEAERILRILLAECPVKQSAALAAQITGQKKNALYERALQIRNEAGG